MMLAETLVFPEDFFFGVGTAAYQIEGDCTKSDWWLHEQVPGGPAKERSGIACDHYRRYREDFNWLKTLEQKAYRFSIEWSRVEPEEGNFDPQALKHYREMVLRLREIGIEPWVTLHHFTLPQWFAQKGGFEYAGNTAYFRRFTHEVLSVLGDLVTNWCTINEPTNYVDQAYRVGNFPPRKQDEDLGIKVLENLFRAHTAAYQEIHDFADEFHHQTPMVGICLSTIVWEPWRADDPDDIAYAKYQDEINNEICFRALRTGVYTFPGKPPVWIPGLMAASDFVGVQYYTRVRLDGKLKKIAPTEAGRVLSQTGWEVYLEGLAPMVRRVAAIGKPLVITENGMAHDDDKVRVRYIIDHLAEILRLIQSGITILGYLYWTLMDNFEWNAGREPCFGLLETDWATLERRPRPSAFFYFGVAKTNSISPELEAEFS